MNAVNNLACDHKVMQKLKNYYDDPRKCVAIKNDAANQELLSIIGAMSDMMVRFCIKKITDRCHNRNSDEAEAILWTLAYEVYDEDLNPFDDAKGDAQSLKLLERWKRELGFIIDSYLVDMQLLLFRFTNPVVSDRTLSRIFADNYVAGSYKRGGADGFEAEFIIGTDRLNYSYVFIGTIYLLLATCECYFIR